LKPPGKTTLDRMLVTVQLEMERIEISQDARVSAGLLREPMSDQVKKRDDFAGIMRMIDIIQADDVLRERLRDRLREVTAQRAAAVALAEAEAAARNAPAGDEESE
jgi:hypothetical protein